MTKSASKVNNLFTLKNLNRILSLTVFVLTIYILAEPFLPELDLFIKRQSDKNQGYVYQSGVISASENKNSELAPPPQENRIIIPSIFVNAAILEGKDISILDNGETWRRPSTSTPDQGSNTVIVAHRYFGNKDENVFYHLNKVKVGDKIQLFWNRQEYVYSVAEIYEVDASQIEIENETVNNQLTLYTCSGLDASQRLVIKALPVLTN